MSDENQEFVNAYNEWLSERTKEKRAKKEEVGADIRRRYPESGEWLIQNCWHRDSLDENEEYIYPYPPCRINVNIVGEDTKFVVSPHNIDGRDPYKGFVTKELDTMKQAVGCMIAETNVRRRLNSEYAEWEKKRLEAKLELGFLERALRLWR